MQDLLNKMDTFQEELSRNGFIEHSNRVEQRKKDFEEPFLLMVVGEGNYGKSTLINSLFNRQVAPISRLPKTWKIDLYENASEDQAILYFNDGKPESQLNLEEAVNVCNEEENKAKNNDSWKSSLYQVKWRVKSDWLDNIVLVDTPGFAQFRSNSSYDKFNLFGAKGIQLEALDGFDYYFYRADFVFWCIKATKLEDADTLDALRSIGDKKAKPDRGDNLYGKNSRREME